MSSYHSVDRPTKGGPQKCLLATACGARVPKYPAEIAAAPIVELERGVLLRLPA